MNSIIGGHEMYWVKRILPSLIIIALIAVGQIVGEEPLNCGGDDSEEPDHGGSGGASHDNGSGPQKGRIDYCCNFDSDRNVGLAPVVVNYSKLKAKCKNDLWDLDINVASQLKNPSYAYWSNDMGAVGKPIEPGLNEKGFPGFVQVYDPGGLGDLDIVAGSKTLKSQNWENAVDGDTYWYSGTTVFTCKGGYEPWVIMQFADYSARKINKIRMLNDTGICDGEGAFSWNNGGQGGNKGGNSGGGCGDDGGCSHDDGDDGGCSHDDGDDGGDDGGCSHDDGDDGGDDDGGCDKDHTTEGDDPGEYNVQSVLSSNHDGGTDTGGGDDSGGGCGSDDGEDSCGGHEDGDTKHGGPCKTIEPCDAQFVSKFKVYTSLNGYSNWTLVLDEYMDANTLTPCELRDGWVEWEINPTKAKFVLVVFEEPFPSKSKMWIHLGEFEVWYDAKLADPALSEMTIAGDDLQPDGIDRAKIKLQINDAEGQAITDLTDMDIKLFSKQKHGKKNIDNECAKTDLFGGFIEVSPGVYSISMTSTKAGLKEIYASINGVVLEQPAMVSFGMDEETGGDTDCTNPNQLTFVRGTETYCKGDMRCDWSNAVDGDLDGWDGIVRARGLGETAAPAWAVFRFCDEESWNFNYVCLTTENSNGEVDQATQFEIWTSITDDTDDAYTKAVDIRRKGSGEEQWYNVGNIEAKFVKLVMTYPINRYKGDWRQLVEFTLQSHTKKGPWKSGGDMNFATLPNALKLRQNYPNPFNPSTCIQFDIPDDTNIKLDIYDINGKHIESLARGDHAAGHYSIEWNAAASPSGIYFYRLQAGSSIQMKRMVFVK
jgi:hypothetical protein